MRTFSPWVLLAAAFALPAPPPCSATESGRPEESFSAAFAADYTVKTDRTVAAGRALAGSPVQSDSYAFTSRRGTPGSAGKTYLRFKLAVREYADATAAATALHRLAGELQGDLFVKWPLLAFTAGSSLYRLDGSCLYSPESWRVIEERLLGFFTFPQGEPPSPRLRIACGGSVQESPPSAEKP